MSNSKVTKLGMLTLDCVDYNGGGGGHGAPLVVGQGVNIVCPLWVSVAISLIDDPVGVA